MVQCVTIITNHFHTVRYLIIILLVFSHSSKRSQDFADISRIVCSLLIMSSLLNILSGYWFRVLSMISFVFYYVILHNQVIIKRDFNDV